MSDKPSPPEPGGFPDALPEMTDSEDALDTPSPTQPEGTTTEVVRSDGREHALVRRFRLLVTAGPDSGVSFTSLGERLVVGTHESADLVLHDRTVSRFHCDITLSEGRAVVRDLGSRNGTLVDGVSIVHAHARSGATLTLGRTLQEAYDRLEIVEHSAEITHAARALGPVAPLPEAEVAKLADIARAFGIPQPPETCAVCNACPNGRGGPVPLGGADAEEEIVAAVLQRLKS